MLTSSKDIIKYRVITQDGKAGKVRDIYLKDNIWATRFLVVGTRRFLPSWSVLMNPQTVGMVDVHRRRVYTSLSRSGLRSCPRASSLTTVSERKENTYLRSNLIRGPHMNPLGFGGIPGIPAGGAVISRPEDEQRENSRRPKELRSFRKLLGYRVRHGGNTLGILEDFLLEDIFWVFRYLVVRRRDGRKILISTDRVETVSWFEQGLWVDMNEEEAERAPEYNARWLDETNRSAAPDAASL